MKKKELKLNLLPPSEPYDPKNIDIKPLVDAVPKPIQAYM